MHGLPHRMTVLLAQKQFGVWWNSVSNRNPSDDERHRRGCTSPAAAQRGRQFPAAAWRVGTGIWANDDSHGKVNRLARVQKSVLSHVLTCFGADKRNVRALHLSFFNTKPIFSGCRASHAPSRGLMATIWRGSQSTALDAWRRAQEDRPGWPEAIRRLVDIGLRSKPRGIAIILATAVVTVGFVP